MKHTKVIDERQESNQENKNELMKAKRIRQKVVALKNRKKNQHIGNWSPSRKNKTMEDNIYKAITQ